MHNLNQYGSICIANIEGDQHQFPNQPLHPYYHGRYVDINPDSYELYSHNYSMLRHLLAHVSIVMITNEKVRCQHHLLHLLTADFLIF